MKLHPVRYSLLKVYPENIDIPLIISQIRKNLEFLSGSRGLAKSGIHIVHSEKKQCLFLILRSRLEDLKLTQSAALMLDIGFIEVLKVSGTIKKLRREISEKDF